MGCGTAIAVETREGVAHVTLKRPERRNAFDAQMAVELRDAAEALGRDPRLRAIVLAGAGPAFCAGADLRWLRPETPVSEAQARDDADRLTRLYQAIDECPCPVIGSIHGAAFGGGVGLVAVCDIAVAAEETVFALSEARLGLVPAIILPYLLRRVGESFLRRYALTGESFSALVARQAGLVHDVVPKDALDKRTDELVGAIQRAGPQAVRATKALLRRLASLPDAERSAACAQANVQARLSPEASEGLRAFFEKRPPAWARGTG
ncbi:enoyl-CoA hydratase-related protein [Nitrospira sp. Kam-Ns4a]